MKWFNDEVEERLKWRWEYARRSKEAKRMISEQASDEEDSTLLSQIYFHFDVMVNLGAISVLYPIRRGDPLKEYRYQYTGMDLYKEYMIISRGGNPLKRLKQEGRRPSITTVHRSSPYPPLEKVQRHNSIVVDINLDRKKEDIHKDIDLLLEVLKKEAKQRKRKPWHSPKRPQFDIYEKIIQVYDMLNESPPKSWSEIAKRIFPDEVHPPEARSKKPRKQESSATPNAINKAMHYAKVAKEMIEEGGWRQI